MPVSQLFKEIYRTISVSKCAMGDHFDKMLLQTARENGIDESLFYSIIHIADNYLEYMMIFQAIAIVKILATYQQTPIYLDVNLDDSAAVNALVFEALQENRP